MKAFVCYCLTPLLFDEALREKVFFDYQGLIQAARGRVAPHLRLLTIEDLLGGKTVDYPQAADVTFKKAQRVSRAQPEKQKTLPIEAESFEE